MLSMAISSLLLGHIQMTYSVINLMTLKEEAAELLSGS